jgi:hypothetical protein
MDRQYHQQLGLLIQRKHNADVVDKLFFDFYPKSNVIQVCPWIYYQHLKRETINKITDDICDFIIKLIDMNNYVYGIFDEAAFSQIQVKHLKISSFPHELFIFGYNDVTKLFDVADFTFTGKYEYVDVSFDEIKEAYSSIDKRSDYLNEGKGGLDILSYNEKGSYCFDSVLVMETLTDYLLSRNSSARDSMRQNPRSSIFGMEVYNYLILYMNNLLEGRGDFDVRPFHFLWDHKVIMLSRIRFMGFQGFLKNSDLIYNTYQEIERDFLIMRNIMLKARITRNYELIYKLIESIHNVSAKEKKVIELMIDNIIVRKNSIQFVDWPDLMNLN